jgi:hypothetical protein
VGGREYAFRIAKDSRFWEWDWGLDSSDMAKLDVRIDWVDRPVFSDGVCMEERVIGRLKRVEEGSVGWYGGWSWVGGEDWSKWPAGVGISCGRSISVILKRIEES